MVTAIDEDFESIFSEINNGKSKDVKIDDNIEKEGDFSEELHEDKESSYPHLEILKEEGLNVSDLPIDIQKKITHFNRKLKIAESSNQEDDIEIQKLSMLIADEIITYIESSDKSYEQIDMTEDVESHKEEGEEEEENKPTGLFEGILGGIFNF